MPSKVNENSFSMRRKRRSTVNIAVVPDVMYFFVMKNTTLFVADIFLSVQGEGPKIGTPSVFLRLGICNLRCAWCDTPYTWKKGMTDYTARTKAEILKKIAALKKGTSVKNIVVTGGEPLLQQKQLAELLADKLFGDMTIEFETNGSMPLLPEMKAFIAGRGARGHGARGANNAVTFNISPKLADSGNKPYNVHRYPGSVLKFVYVNKKSEKMIDDFLKKYRAGGKISADGGKPLPPVSIMPEGVTVEAMSSKYHDIIRYCTKNGFRFTPRLHIYLFGNQRAT